MAVKVKVCGLTRLEDARLALDYGADLLGFVLYPKSPRCAHLEQVQEIVHALKSQGRTFTAVGVFVNETAAAMRQIMATCLLDAAQLHGDEGPEMLGMLGGISGRAYKAVQPRSSAEAEDFLARYALPPEQQQGGRLPALLLDAYHPRLRGGSGTSGNWEAAASIAQQAPILLAGGLNAENILPAIRTVRPWGVDAASGIEAAPGKKDPEAMKRFIELSKSIYE